MRDCPFRKNKGKMIYDFWKDAQCASYDDY